MPISQINKINQVENLPQKNIVESHPERESSMSREMPKVEFGRDNLAEEPKPVIKPVTTSSIKSSTGEEILVDQKFRRIEEILEEDLAEVYFNLSPQKQQEFKVKGEETTIKIINLLSKPKVKIKKIISLVRDWLKIIPGINVFFLEQVVKIKADKIINETSKRK